MKKYYVGYTLQRVSDGSLVYVGGVECSAEKLTFQAIQAWKEGLIKMASTPYVSINITTIVELDA